MGGFNQRKFASSFFWFIVPVIHLALGLVLGYFSSALLTDGVSSRSASGV
jgi:hypothetical protein